VKHLHGVGASYRAWACDLDGELAGVIGLALTRPRACLFCWFDEKLRPHLKSVAVLRLVKKTEALMQARGLPVYAIRQADEPKAAEMLTRLGFTPLDVVDGDEVWEFEP
jgi:hypothetical protein